MTTIAMARTMQMERFAGSNVENLRDPVRTCERPSGGQRPRIIEKRKERTMEDRIDVLARRARRFRAKGEFRKAANAYGELTSIEPHVARWWVLLATMLHEAHRVDESVKAFRQANFLFRHAGQHARMRSVRRLMATYTDLPAEAA
jgi:hypothetical protein